MRWFRTPDEATNDREDNMQSIIEFKTAVDGYARRHFEAITLLRHIESLLLDLPAPDDYEDKIHWGHVGDLGHVVASLEEVAAFLEAKHC